MRKGIRTTDRPINWDYIRARAYDFKEATTQAEKDMCLFFMGQAAHIISIKNLSNADPANSRFPLTERQRQNILAFMKDSEILK